MRYTAGPPDARTVVTATQEQLHRAGQGPNSKRPAYELMYLMGDPKNGARGPKFVSKNYRNLDGKHGWVTGNRIEPLTTALPLAGAARVDEAASRPLDTNLGLIRPHGRQ